MVFSNNCQFPHVHENPSPWTSSNNNPMFYIHCEDWVSSQPCRTTKCTSLLHSGIIPHTMTGQTANGVETEDCESPRMIPEVQRRTSLTNTPAENRLLRLGHGQLL